MSNLAEYILGTKIKAAILQAFLESKKDIDFISLEELAFAIASDSIRILETEKLITVNRDLK